MNGEQIIKMAVEKALNNGWNGESCFGKDFLLLPNYDQKNTKNFWKFIHHKYPEIIFSHGFVKAFWKQQGLPTEMGDYEWQLRLQDMVLEENPIKYLEQFLEK